MDDAEGVAFRGQSEKGDIGDSGGEAALGRCDENEAWMGSRRHGGFPQNAKTRRERRAGMKGVLESAGWLEPPGFGLHSAATA